MIATLRTPRREFVGIWQSGHFAWLRPLLRIYETA